MHKNMLTVVGITILFLGSCITQSFAIDNVKKASIPISSGNTLYVGGTGEGNYSKIQDAIDNASDGDIVFVYNGTYYEYVVVDKSINIIGENRETTVIDRGGIGSVVFISGYLVNISGFTIQNRGDYFTRGISIFDAGKDILIYNNIIIGNNIGIDISFMINGTYIYDNIIKENGDGINLFQISDVKIYNNTISNNEYSGIEITASSNCDITENIISNNNRGIWLRNIPYLRVPPFVYHNEIRDNKFGVGVSNGIGKISSNNFIDNEIQAIVYTNSLIIPHFRRTIWIKNYWNRTRLLPKPILCFCSILLLFLVVPMIQFDWRPALKPYDTS